MDPVNSRSDRPARGLRRRRRPEATRRRILAAATSEFAAKGLAGARVDAIAHRARVSKRMLYHYFGNKEALWLAVLEQAYLHIRNEERELDVGRLSPVAGMRCLIEFTIAYDHSHPEFISLLLGENLHQARYLRRSRKVRELHTSLLGVIADLLERGRRTGVFRAGIDPAELYITIAALGFFYFSNIHTLSTIFGRDFNSVAARRRHLRHATRVVLGFLRP
ncbi:MAG: TetR family transcriptional regulator [Alphaproteobacteria bacterium]|nr:TetR family transcriptional regulator [Alphaproteobacteria bacterium]